MLKVSRPGEFLVSFLNDEPNFIMSVEDVKGAVVASGIEVALIVCLGGV